VITTLTGENSYAWGEVLSQLIDDFVANYSALSVERLDGEEVDLASIQQALTRIAFLSTHQLLILRTPSKNKQFLELYESLLSTIADVTDVIIVEPKLDKRLSYYKYLKQKTDFREFPQLDQHALAHWLTKTAQDQKGSLNLSDARYLLERVGTNQQLLINELNKLLLYDRQINRQTIDLLTEPIPQSSIFELLEAAFNGKNSQTLHLYSQQRLLKVEPQQIIAMIAWQLHVLSVIKAAKDRGSDQIAQEAGISPYVLRKSYVITHKLNLAELKKRVSDLMTIDQRIKRSLIDPDEALQHYLLRF